MNNSKSKTIVHRSLRLTYYNAWQDAKKEIKQKGRELVSADGEIVKESKFDYKA